MIEIFAFWLVLVPNKPPSYAGGLPEFDNSRSHLRRSLVDRSRSTNEVSIRRGVRDDAMKPK